MDKKKNAEMLDPTRFKISKQNAVVPGGPQNNNPMNVTGIGQQSASPNGMSQHPYGDTGNIYQQMGADILNPMNTGPSGLQQNFPMGLKNNSMPFGMQQQPPSSQGSKAWEGMEATRYNDGLKQRGLPTGSYLGLTGFPAQPAPGAYPGNFSGSSGPPLMQGMESAEQAAGGGMSPQNSMNPMTPGSSKTTIKKKRK